MVFDKSAIDIMKKRQSIRTFSSQDIAASHIQLIQDYLRVGENLMGPLGEKGKIQLVHVTNNVTDKGIKLGTYGFIKNPKAYLVGIGKNNKYSLIDFAYTFHRLVLYVEELGLGTCWMGGTFNRDSFEKEIDMVEGDFIPCITPIGYPNEKQRVFDKAVRYVVKADNKKTWDKMFYDTAFEQALTKEESGSLEIPIEMVRLGPSASNKQPWRLVLSEDRKQCHFYIEHTPNYSSKLGYDMQLLDMGIAMCQFEMACKELNIDGKWQVKEPNMTVPNVQVEYIVSWLDK
ncbi:nitroreductase family protein [Bacillus sp. 31A1R]|uniref:Nitroreductase family protein n=1 Tax=Robertmurraya mangrovi TaxID=3098077 RepID=A0ABU5IWE9_9BACI|nr:nitroreductase family protein [Bacillus sp. 31A1R]MDZ5471479.1 nitroreductase family protein [Bacillus sp. 31A1R]